MTQIQLLQVWHWEFWQLSREVVEADTEASQFFQLGPIHLSQSSHELIVPQVQDLQAPHVAQLGRKDASQAIHIQVQPS